MAAKIGVPKFRSEKQEAEWWDAHPEVITALFLKAKKEGKIKRLPVVRRATKPVTIRLPVADVETAQELADKRGLPYQTYIKTLLHQALEHERKAGSTPQPR
jgi:predicted DNA binding CopG/RHH family protein